MTGPYNMSTRRGSALVLLSVLQATPSIIEKILFIYFSFCIDSTYAQILWVSLCA